ncbi:MAG: hypothetical protein QOI42_1878 [Frankiaceae bacterium]|nr:hypothetical protein [Frankiaceae bacterium]
MLSVPGRVLWAATDPARLSSMGRHRVGVENRALSRRELLKYGVAAPAVFGVASALGLGNPAAAPAALPAAVAGTGGVDLGLLPTARHLYRDVKRMVDLGQRLPGNSAHNAFIDWLDRGFRSAGCRMLPRDEFPFTRWLADRWSLELLDGPGRGVVPVSAYQPYSGNTPASGVVGQLAYLGAVPPLALSGDPQDVTTLRAAVERLKDELADWASAAIAGVPGGVAGRIVLVDAQTLPLTEKDFAPLTTYAHDPDSSPFATPNFKRMALSLIPPASVFAQAGAAGYIVTLDASAPNAAGTYGPYGSAITGLPGLLIDRDTGAKLRRYAAGRPNARLTLSASVTQSSTPQLVGILPGDGSIDEVMIVNTHTDGMNAFEENGGIGLVWLARYFSRLPKGRRLKRSLVFSAVSGHFAGPAPRRPADSSTATPTSCRRQPPRSPSSTSGRASGWTTLADTTRPAAPTCSSSGTPRPGSPARWSSR